MNNQVLAFDLGSLLEPISADAPSGEDMSFSIEFDAIQEARREDDPSLDQGEWVTDIKDADWSEVMRACAALLQTQTKDLRLASWYTEAATKTVGIAGMGQGFRLMQGILDHYWDSVHPQPEDGDSEQRIGNLSWLITRCRELSRELPLVSNKTQRYGLLVWEAARTANARKDSDGNEGTPPKVNLQQYREAQKHTPAAFYEQLLKDCALCREALEDLTGIVDQRLGLDGPSFTPLRDALETYIDAAQRAARENGVGGLSLPDNEVIVEPAKDAESSSVPAAQPGGPLRSREQALQQLRQVAEYFRRTEPHSPVAYLADKAARWGGMPLHEWLRSVLKEDAAMARFEDLLGVQGMHDSE